MKRVLNSDYADLHEFVEGLPAGIFAYSGTTLHTGRNTVKLFEVNGRKIVVKKYRRPNFFNRIVYSFFRGSKARRAYKNALKLDSLDVATPTPIAYMDVRSGGLINSSYLVTEYTDWEPMNKLPLMEKFEQVMLNDAFVKFTVELHKKGIQHNDYNTSNVLFHRHDDFSYRFMLIDINRMHFGHMSKTACLSNLKRFCEDSDAVYRISQKYAEERGWSKYGTLATLAAQRGVFERRRQNKVYLKELIKGHAGA